MRPSVQDGLHGVGAPRETRDLALGRHQVAARSQVGTSEHWAGRAPEGACVTWSTLPSCALPVSQLRDGDVEVTGLARAWYSVTEGPWGEVTG